MRARQLWLKRMRWFALPTAALIGAGVFLSRKRKIAHKKPPKPVPFNNYLMAEMKKEAVVRSRYT